MTGCSGKARSRSEAVDNERELACAGLGSGLQAEEESEGEAREVGEDLASLSSRCQSGEREGQEVRRWHCAGPGGKGGGLGLTPRGGHGGLETGQKSGLI